MKTNLLTLLFPAACIISNLHYSQLVAQAIQPRLNQGAILEPQGKIINGAGQDQAAYMNYWNVMHAQNKPLIYMTYINLRDVTSDWAEGLKANLMLNAVFQIPQIGLAMTVDGTPSSIMSKTLPPVCTTNKYRCLLTACSRLRFQPMFASDMSLMVPAGMGTSPRHTKMHLYELPI